MAARKSIRERFEAKVSKDGPIPDPTKYGDIGCCYPWTACRDMRPGKGYGWLGINGKNVQAHRVAWMLAHGPIEKGAFVCHHCDNPGCVRLSHLFLGDAPKNSEDMRLKGRAASGDRHGSRTHPERIARGDRNGLRLHPERAARGDAHGSKTHPESVRYGDRNWSHVHADQMPRGSNHGMAKLTEADVSIILSDLARGVSGRALSRRFKVDKAIIYRIRDRKIWRHVQLVSHG